MSRIFNPSSSSSPSFSQAPPDFLDTGPAEVNVNPAFACLLNARRVLMLQGPVGPFFDRVARFLIDNGTSVQRVVFQGGDERDCRTIEPTRFTAPPDAWPAKLSHLIRDTQPDCILLFGQSRYYHKVALERARATDLPVVVMEEGYFRPGFVTMELGGVNGYSKTLDRYVLTSHDQPHPRQAGVHPHHTPCHFQKMAWHACQHYLGMRDMRSQYPHYVHHRHDDVYFYAKYWSRSFWRKLLRKREDYRLQNTLFRSETPYFFVPLQVEGDSQLTHHSPFNNNAEFIVQTLGSFARCAPSQTRLVFRQHPHSRGGRGHEGLVRELADGLGVGERVHFLVEGDTPELAQHSRGVIVINSTVGLQALERGAPLMVLGDALYKQEGLTFSGTLDDFWLLRHEADPARVEQFLWQVKNLTQAPASVYALRGEPLQWTAHALSE